MAILYEETEWFEEITISDVPTKGQRKAMGWSKHDYLLWLRKHAKR